MSLKAKIEAVLFLTAKPIKAQAMARIVNADVQAVRQALLELVHDYEERQGGLEIADDDGYSLQVKDEYANLMNEFLPVEMSAALIRTLSAIAIKQPISQSEIIRVRGAGAYEHIKELVNRELIAKRDEPGGRSPILTTTRKFQEYFRLTKDGKDLRNYLKRQVRKASAAKDAARVEGQLVIAEVVSSPETDNELNSRIFLETADMAAAREAAELDAAEASAAATTLSKLAAAAQTTQPQPLKADETLPPPPPATADDEPATPAPKTGKSTVQAHAARSGPPIGSNKKKRPPELSDLLRKQRELEKALKKAKRDKVEQTMIDFTPPVSAPQTADKIRPL